MARRFFNLNFWQSIVAGIILLIITSVISYVKFERVKELVWIIITFALENKIIIGIVSVICVIIITIIKNFSKILKWFKTIFTISKLNDKMEKLAKSINEKILNFSVPLVVKKNGVDIFGSAFFIVKKNEGGTMQLFLITSYVLVENAEALTFAVRLNDHQLQWISIESKDIADCEIEKYDIARFNISKTFDILSNTKINKMEVEYLYIENIIPEEIIKNMGISENLFVISNTPVEPAKPKESTTICFPTLTKCQNATNLDGEYLGFFIVNLKRDKWRLGSPVFVIFDNKIKLVGMVSNLGDTPNDLSSVTPASAIVELLEMGKKIKQEV